MICKIYLKATKGQIIDIYSNFLEKVSEKAGLSFIKQGLPTRIRKISLYRSPHVHKKSKEHYEVRNYQSLVVIKGNNSINFVSQVLKMKPIDIVCKLSIENK
jgi:ribosomal protein S10